MQFGFCRPCNRGLSPRLNLLGRAGAWRNLRLVKPSPWTSRNPKTRRSGQSARRYSIARRSFWCQGLVGPRWGLAQPTLAQTAAIHLITRPIAEVGPVGPTRFKRVTGHCLMHSEVGLQGHMALWNLGDTAV